MIELSVQTINNAAPYRVVRDISNGDFRFATDAGVNYSVGFVPDDMVRADQSYQFVIVNVNNRKSPRDIKVRDTLMAIVEEFFEKNQSTLLYICDTNGNHQEARARLFAHWFTAYSKKHLYVNASAAITDAEGVINYATIIARKDNPHLLAIMNEFFETVQMFSQKPE